MNGLLGRFFTSDRRIIVANTQLVTNVPAPTGSPKPTLESE